MYIKVMISKLELFNNKEGILNFEHIAMHCGLSMEIQLFSTELYEGRGGAAMDRQ